MFILFYINLVKLCVVWLWSKLCVVCDEYPCVCKQPTVVNAVLSSLHVTVNHMHRGRARIWCNVTTCVKITINVVILLYFCSSDVLDRILMQGGCYLRPFLFVLIAFRGAVNRYRCWTLVCSCPAWVPTLEPRCLLLYLLVAYLDFWGNITGSYKTCVVCLVLC